jgi:UDPglucose 6-dehydrogenase
MKTVFPDITYAETAIKVLDSDAIIIVTEWEEFKNLNYTGKIVIDGRRIKKAQQEARIYEGFCW